jgi:hypothetical protein
MQIKIKKQVKISDEVNKTKIKTFINYKVKKRLSTYLQLQNKADVMISITFAILRTYINNLVI